MTRVLVVDDDEDVRLLLHSVLSLTGFDVLDADCAATALEVLDQASPAPDVAILDLRMPDIDGWGLLDRIRSAPATRDLPVIVCSANASFGDIATGRALGCDGYLQKPFDVHDLVEEVTAVTTARRRR